MKKFIRQDSNRYSKLGKGRRKLQKWRKPKGRHSKMRERRRSYPPSPSVGYKMPKDKAGRIKGLIPILINNVKDLNSIKSGNIAVISSRVGARKKIDILKNAAEMKIEVLNAKGEAK